MIKKNRDLFGLPQHAIEKISCVFAKYPAIQTVIIYGSRAQGNQRIGSDIDLCIDADTLNFTQLAKIESELDNLLLPWKIDLSLKHQIDNPTLLEHIQEEGVVFYEKAQK